MTTNLETQLQPSFSDLAPQSLNTTGLERTFMSEEQKEILSPEGASKRKFMQQSATAIGVGLFSALIPKFAFAGGRVDLSRAPGILETRNRLGKHNPIESAISAYKHHTVDAYTGALNALDIVDKSIGYRDGRRVNPIDKLQEPAYWVVLGLVDSKEYGRVLRNELNRIRGNFSDYNKPVKYFAEAFDKFWPMWVPLGNDRSPQGGSLKECRECELDFLKSMFTAVGLQERDAITYQNSDINDRTKIVNNALVPNMLNNTDYMQKLWFSWALTFNIVNYDYMANKKHQGTNMYNYGFQNSNLMYDSIEKPYTPKKGKNILPQIRGPPWIINSNFYI